MNFLVRWLTTVTTVALFSAFLAASPAEATLGAAIPFSLQVRGYSSLGVATDVGRAVGTVQFDDGNAYYYLSFVLCRQSSYATPLLIVSATGSTGLSGNTYAGDNTVRTDICTGSGGMAYEFSSGISYSGVLSSITITLQGVYMNGATAERPTRSVTLDNPYS